MQHDDDVAQVATQGSGRRRKPWVVPELRELPRLTDLTLQTGSPIPGTGNPGGGSSVF
jgi:hypothetical protein